MITTEKNSSPFFTPIDVKNLFSNNISSLTDEECSKEVAQNKESLLTGRQILCGIPFELGNALDEKNILLLKDCSVTYELPAPVCYEYLVFLHTVDSKSSKAGVDGITPHSMGSPRLGETVAEYVFHYSDGTCHSIPIKRRFNINEFMLDWGEGSFECVPHTKPQSFLSNTDELIRGRKQLNGWGQSQFRTAARGDDSKMQHWLYAAKNPYPDRELVSISFIPKDGIVFLFGITGCLLGTNPIRWEAAKRVRLTLPDNAIVNEFGEYDDIDLDLGKVIAVTPVRDYDNDSWENGYNNKQPVLHKRSVIVEYTAHDDACIYLGSEGLRVPLKEIESQEYKEAGYIMQKVAEPAVRVTLRILDKKSGRPVPAKLHIHGANGEYLPPMNRHRYPNPHWFEDYSVDFTNGNHYAAYVDGEVVVSLPLGEIFIEVSKGFEIMPVRIRRTINPETTVITIYLEHVLPWRQKGWVTADTHVHFLSPQSALLEGSAEGVNVVNLLASQWGELFTNIGDFDGATTIGSVENGGTGEYLVRVGTENRQHILGHISLLGYQGRMILPLTTGGPDESRLGDGVETTISQWAEQCRAQNGLVILPHFPRPRSEGAAAIVSQLVDGVEMTAWDQIYSGINPYSLSDWYRYLNCGYNVPAVGGTDKMSASTPVGGVRTYALIKDAPFTYESWMEVVRKGLTFVTYGPLIDFHVNGQDCGSTINLGHNGGTLDICWQVSSVIVPVTQVELVVNGELREVKAFDGEKSEHSGTWSVNMEESGWLALRVRARYPDRQEMIGAHSSAIMVMVGNKPIFNKLDAITILEQIEGAEAYIKSLGTRAEERKYKEALAKLTAAHRSFHNYMHQNGMYHNHTTLNEHHGD